MTPEEIRRLLERYWFYPELLPHWLVVALLDLTPAQRAALDERYGEGRANPNTAKTRQRAIKALVAAYDNIGGGGDPMALKIINNDTPAERRAKRLAEAEAERKRQQRVPHWLRLVAISWVPVELDGDDDD